MSVKFDGKFTVTIEDELDGTTAFRTIPKYARLFAAAPDLLEALEFSKSSLMVHLDPTNPTNLLLLKMVNKAIAKTKVEQVPKSVDQW